MLRQFPAGQVMTQDEFMESAVRQAAERDHDQLMAVVYGTAIIAGLICLFAALHHRRYIGQGIIFLLGRVYKAHRIAREKAGELSETIRKSSES